MLATLEKKGKSEGRPSNFPTTGAFMFRIAAIGQKIDQICKETFLIGDILSTNFNLEPQLLHDRKEAAIPGDSANPLKQGA